MNLKKFLGCSFILFAYLTIHHQYLTSDDLNIQNIESLDKVNSLSNYDNSKTWYALNKVVDPIQFQMDWENQRINLDDWKLYSPPGSLYDTVPEWEGSKHIAMLKLIKIPVDWNSAHISIRLGIITDKDKVYVNGELIGFHGDFDSEKPEGYDKIRIYKIPSRILKRGEINTILVNTKTFFSYTGGVEQDSLKIGPSERIEGELLNDEYIKIFLLMIYSTVGIYFLFLFLRRRKDYENLFFALFTISLVIYQFLRNQLKYNFGIEFLLLKKTEYLVLMMLIPFMYHFIRTYFHYNYRLIFKLVDGIIGIAFVYILISNNVIHYDILNKYLIQILWILYLGATIVYLVLQSQKKNLDAILMLVGFSFLISAAVLDILSTRNIIVFPRMSGYAFIVLILSIATILANKFVRLNIEVEELNTNLEKKVLERTDELNTTLEEVKKLKVQQDGDYFLTSLLLNPLIVDSNNSNIVLTEFFTKQKKDFEFKGKKYEIGGDISIASNIELKGRKYTVFINGDAMGKSMQGAGGALVLGVVFNAVLTRSGAESNKNKHPENWLKEAFMDLQRVFESFNGSMLISVVLGLVEEDTGMLYYINAEHPWTVLLRDGKASFIERELLLRKIGFPDNEDSFFIRTFQLRDGDILIAGSDGRDDILLGYDEDGTRIINEDENAFVEVVEKSQGSINEIIESLEGKGEYTDDITLLKISYVDDQSKKKNKNYNNEKPLYERGKELILKGNLDEGISLLEESLKNENNHLEQTTSLLGQSYFKLKLWEKALENFERSLEIKPSSSELLFYASYSAKMSKKLLKATDLGERCYLRDPSNPKNLINLADIYKKVGRKDRALHLVNRALKEDHQNRNALRLKELLDRDLPTDESI